MIRSTGSSGLQIAMTLLGSSPNRNSDLSHMLAVSPEFESLAGAFKVPHSSVRDPIGL
jgi:hypothetical protein